MYLGKFIGCFWKIHLAFGWKVRTHLRSDVLIYLHVFVSLGT